MRHVDPRQLMFVFPMCSRCGNVPRRLTHAYCHACHAAYMRGWRPGHPLNAEQRRKDNARSYAGTYKRRGKLLPQNCAHCGSAKSEMHHPDYSQPTAVEWLCRPCHLAHHKELSENVSRLTIERTEIHSIAA